MCADCRSNQVGKLGRFPNSRGANLRRRSGKIRAHNVKSYSYHRFWLGGKLAYQICVGGKSVPPQTLELSMIRTICAALAAFALVSFAAVADDAAPAAVAPAKPMKAKKMKMKKAKAAKPAADAPAAK